MERFLLREYIVRTFHGSRCIEDRAESSWMDEWAGGLPEEATGLKPWFSRVEKRTR